MIAPPYFKQFNFSIGLVFLLLLVEIFTLLLGVTLSNKAAQEVTIVNLAGRQRMLSQYISKSLLQLYLEYLQNQLTTQTMTELNTSATLFHDTLLAFKHGGQVTNTDDFAITIQPLPSKEAILILDQALELWLPFYQEMQVIINKNEITNNRLTKLVKKNKTLNIELLKLMNQLTFTLEQRTVSYSRLLQYSQLTGFLLVFLLFAFIFSYWRKVKLTLIDQKTAIKSQLNNIEESYQLAITGSNDGLWDWFDIQEQQQWVSDRFYQLLGYTKKSYPLELIDNFFQLVHPEERDAVKQAINAHLYQKQPYEMEYRIYTYHQGYRWFLARGQALWDAKGQPIRMSGSITDIHVIKKTSQKLKEQATLYVTLLNTIPHLIWLTDHHGKVQFLNAAWLQMTGLTIEQGLEDAWLQIVHPDEVIELTQKWKAACQMLQYPFEGEVRIRLSHGDYHIFHYIGTPIFDDAGEVIHWVGVNTDITSLKKAELILQDFNKQLTQEVAIRTQTLSVQEEELLKAKEIAEAANRAKTFFLASMSHELRTPLNIILGYIKTLETENSLPNEQRHHLSVILHNAQHLSSLLNDLLDLSHIESNYFKLIFEEFFINEILTDLIDAFTFRAVEKNINFNVVLAENIPLTMIGDKLRLKQVLFNLLGNAIKFTKAGSVTLSIDLKDQRLFFEVCDTGCGIPDHEQVTIFKSFHQLSELKNKSSGMGLGLTISQRLVKLMGSTLAVKSEPKQGSCFSFQLQLLKGNLIDGVLKRQFVIGLHCSDRPKLLLAVKHKEKFLILSRFLESIGFQIEVVIGGETAWQYLIHDPSFSLLIADLDMPYLNGLALSQRIRQDEIYQHLPIIILSNKLYPQAKQLCQGTGANYLLELPINLEQLLIYIQQLLKLEWIYNDDKKVPVNKKIELANIHLPTFAYLQEVANCLIEGDFNAAVQAVKALAQHAEYHDFTQLLLKIAEQYEVDLFEQMIERSIDIVRKN